MNRAEAFNKVFTPTYAVRKLPTTYPANCRMDHPPIGYFPNDWGKEYERCPVCCLLDYIVYAAGRK